jgi:hypothetical protein
MGAAIGFNGRMFQPFLGILSDFWFYQFHVKKYPDIVEYFTKEIDLLNELRIKPQFMDFEVEVGTFEQRNNEYSEVLEIHGRQPESIYSLQSLKEVYMINFALSLAFFALHNVFSRTLKLCGSENDTLRAVQRYFASHSHWWCLLVSAIETNISVLTFYSAVQLNAFSSFESLDRLSLLMGKAMLFLPFFYSFFVYTIIFAFYSKSKSKNVLGISKYSERGMILEMSVNCIFPFLSALAHGLFLDCPEIQVPSLILVNICELIAVFRFRDVFSFRFDMATMLVYKIGLLVFNVFILLFNFWEHSSIPFNFCFMVILAFLILVTLLKMVVGIGLTFY